MSRGFGIDAGVPAKVAGEVAALAEQLGYTSFWVNGSPHSDALASLQSAADASGIEVGVGVLPLTRISTIEIVDAIRHAGLPEERLLLGVGSSRSPGALAEVREAARLIRSETAATVVTAAVGPKMTELAGEIADVVLFTWWTAPDVFRSRRLIEAGAEKAGRSTPAIASYIRCALLPDAAEAVAERAAAYAAIPRYAEVFARNRMEAADTIVTGEDAVALAPGIAREESVLDVPIIRAITREPTVASIGALLEACAPTS